MKEKGVAEHCSSTLYFFSLYYFLFFAKVLLSQHFRSTWQGEGKAKFTK